MLERIGSSKRDVVPEDDSASGSRDGTSSQNGIWEGITSRHFGKISGII
jgi:hypothetical protein